MSPVARQPTASRRQTGRRRLTRRRLLIVSIALGLPVLVLGLLIGSSYVRMVRVVDERLHGERERAFPHVYGRPLEIRQGQSLGPSELVDRLNDLGYALRPQASGSGEFSVADRVVTLMPREGSAQGRTVRVRFRALPAAQTGGSPPASLPASAAGRIERIEVVGHGPVDAVTLDHPLISTLITGEREKRRRVSLSLMPPHLIKAVLAIEDKRFYEHPGVDVIRGIKAIITNVRGDKPYLEGASTITQQLVKNVFLAAITANPLEKSLRRKLLEQFMAIVLERRATKDEILELYLNEVYLGQRGSFAIHGVAEGARLFFGKDVTNLSLTEAATLAGVIKSPPYYSPFSSPRRARERRNLVLQAMVDAGFLEADTARAAEAEPLETVARALEAEAPYFVDLVGRVLADQCPTVTSTPGQVDVFTTLDLHLQRIAQDAVREGLAEVDRLLGKRRQKLPPVQAALIALDPRTGDLLALVGGRSYNQSQFNRAVRSARQPGSAFKPFVYLAAFELAAEERRTDLSPATLVVDEPTTFTFENRDYTPSNYEDEYDGEITFRRALAHSRNVATVKVAEAVGFGRVADLWKRIGVSAAPQPYPSIALGAFEVAPLDLATAYTLFPNLGEIRPPRVLSRVVKDGREIAGVRAPAPRRVARPDTTYLVVDMMRSVLDEGTGAQARARGFLLDAAGKTGTTNDLRDAWFVGFTPELLAVVWVGLDDNQPLGLSGSQAALPIWTLFMVRALAGRPAVPFEIPEGVSFVEIDRDTGRLALPTCPRVIREAFLTGLEPTETCALHRYH